MENLESKPVNYDQTEVNQIEDLLKTTDIGNLSKIPTRSLVTFIRAKSQNILMNPMDMDGTKEYLNKIKRSRTNEVRTTIPGNFGYAF